MTYTSSAAAAIAFKKALRTAMVGLVAADDTVLVTFGHPGQQIFSYDDLVMLEDLTAEQEPATVSTNRTREDTLTQVVAIESFRAGGPEAEETSAAAAYALLALLEGYVRATDTTLGGVVRHCFLTSHRSQGFTPPGDQDQGRITVLEATFTAKARITT